MFVFKAAVTHRRGGGVRDMPVQRDEAEVRTSSWRCSVHESVFRVVDPELVCGRAQHAGDLAADLRSFGNLRESRNTMERLHHSTVSRKSWRRS